MSGSVHAEFVRIAALPALAALPTPTEIFKTTLTLTTVGGSLAWRCGAWARGAHLRHVCVDNLIAWQTNCISGLGISWSVDAVCPMKVVGDVARAGTGVVVVCKKRSVAHYGLCGE